MDRKLFEKPGNECRPMKLRHDYDCLRGKTKEEKEKIIGAKLDVIKKIGYGGVTTNTPSDEYLTEEGWQDFETIVKMAKEKGLRLWIYDEKGYPSGTAGGLTLKNHPEYESKALVSKFEEVEYGENVSIKMPKYHTKLVAAYAYKIEVKDRPDSARIYSKPDDILVDGFTGNSVDLMRFATKNGGLKWKAGDGFVSAKEGDIYVVCIYWSKVLYEYTHACQNFHECRRYISMINKDAVAEFIKNTYEEYKKHAGNDFGSAIEAFFTDEPSIMAGYLDGSVHPGEDGVKDKPNYEIKRLPLVQWEDFLLDEFRNRYGYSLNDNLHYLYAGTSKRAVKVRYDFNLLVMKCYEESFFGQIEKFCHKNNVDFSGHVLMEEYLLHHGIWEGNIFRIMSHLDIPGIDCLTTIPEEIIDMTVVQKLVSSATAWFGKKHTMSESSAFFQRFFSKAPYGAREMRASAATQMIMGVDNFQSYYGEDEISEKEYISYTDYVGRIGEAIKGGINSADIILYYPIEGVIAGAKGSEKFREVRDYSKAEIECEQSWNGLAKLLIKNKLDYVMADAEAIENLCICPDEDCPCLVNMKTGCSYKAIVIPKMVATSGEFLETLAEYAENGITVIFDSLKTGINSLCEEDLKGEIAELLSMENVINCDTEDIPEILKEKFLPQVEVENDCKIIYTKREETDIGLDEVFVIQNTGAEKCNHDVYLTVEDGFDNILIMNPDDGSVNYADFEYTEDGRVKINIDFDGYETVIIGIE